MALDGAPVRSLPETPPMPRWPERVTADEDYVPDAEVDFAELSEINRMLNRCRARMFRTSAALKAAQRSYGEAQIAYDRAMRRHMVTLSGGTEASRRAMAEILCEDLENDVIVMRQVVEECKKRSLDVRDDLKAVENLAHNARAQMAVM